MKINNIGGYPSVDRFVDAKLARYNASDKSFSALFALMFSEGDNVLWEESRGYRIAMTTYAQAKSEILRRAATLRRLLADTPSNAVVGLYMDNSLEWIECFWAVLRAGFRPLLLNLRLDDETLAYALRVTGAAAVVSDGKVFAVRTIPAEDLAAEEGALPERFGTEIMVMSSGTSAHVKICAYTAEKFYYQIQGSYDMIRRCAQVKKHYEGQLKLLTFLPFYHIFGLVAVYIWFAFFSRTFVRLNDMQPQTIVNTIKRHKVTHVFAVPLFWEKVCEQAMRTISERGEATVRKFEKGMRISRRLGDSSLADAFAKIAFRKVRDGMFGESIQFMIAGGSCIRPQTMEFFNAIGYRLADGYGMSEIGITSVELSSRRSLLNSCSVGTPMKGMEYRINEKGELLVRGKAMAQYVIEDGQPHDNPEWFNTHDLVSFDGSAYRILGRQDDLIVAPNGENLNPNLIESRLSLDGAEEICLVGLRQSGTTTPVLLISVSPYITGERLRRMESDLRRQLSALRLAGQVSKLVFTGERLMLDTEFKLNRTRLARALADGTLREVVPDRALLGRMDDDIARRITAMFAMTLHKPEDEIAPDADFFADLGGTSLDYFALIAGMRDAFRVSFRTGDMSMSTVRALHDYVLAHIE
ncbi:MAG: AMP-binding protein [Ruminococcus sp.]|nr:AMP-binding protein [Ruminococcus sp.]